MQLSTKIVIAILAGLWISAPRLIPSEKMTGPITEITSPSEDIVPSQNATIKLSERVVTAQIYETQVGYKIGDRVILRQDPVTGQFTVSDFSRTPQLLQLFILFLLTVVVVSGIAGLRSLLGLVASFVIIFAFVLPQIASGANPLLVTLLASSMILLFSYYLTHGFSTKTTIALVGTGGALVITGILAWFYTLSSRLSGFGSEEASFLLSQMPAGNMQNLLLSGMIIATLGVLDDVTISQASVVLELREANPKLSSWELLTRAMKVGRDHIASVVNTLVLVYAGTALPLLLLFTNSEAGALELLNYEAVAEEIVRTLVGSIGLITAVPITTIIAAYWYQSKR